VIYGDPGDMVTLEVPGSGEPGVGVGGAWTIVGTTTIDAENFDVVDYVLNGEVLASVAIDQDTGLLIV
jgi:hypothetical protein